MLEPKKYESIIVDGEELCGTCYPEYWDVRIKEPPYQLQMVPRVFRVYKADPQNVIRWIVFSRHEEQTSDDDRKIVLKAIKRWVSGTPAERS